MNDPTRTGDFAQHRKSSVEIWNNLAQWWHDSTGEADEFHRRIVIPPTDELLALTVTDRVLDVACGNGAYARHLAKQCAEVVAFDASSQLIDIARQQTNESQQRISYHHVDAGDRSALLAIGERKFDAAVCKMALMDMATIDPLILSLSRILKKGGRFVFSVLHPAFNSTGSSMLAEQATAENGELSVKRAIKIERYLTPESKKGIAIVGQPRPHFYFHRSISGLLQSFFNAGFVMNGIAEPPLPEDWEAPNVFAWAHFKQIPPVLIARMTLFD